jgi:hypothetical protein
MSAGTTIAARLQWDEKGVRGHAAQKGQLMRSIQHLGLSLLLSGLAIVAGACTRTTESEGPDRTEKARPAPTEAAAADETFAPTAGNHLANEDGATSAATPATGEATTPAPAPERTDRHGVPDTVGAPRAATTGSSDTPPAGREARSEPRDTSPSASAAPLAGVVTVPEGTSLPLVLTSGVGSDTSEVEDPVSARLASRVDVEGTTVIPEGSVVRGTVSDVQRSGRVKGVARLGVRFHTLVIGEQIYDIRAAPVSRQAPRTVKKDTQKVAIPAAAGGVIGAIAGGGKGAAIGAAAGAAAGTGVVVATRGQEVRLASGARVTTTLSAPLDVTVKN